MTNSRAEAYWARSCSKLGNEFLRRFGPSTIQAAHDGCASIISNHYGGERQGIAHVDKKANFLRHWQGQIIGDAFFPSSSLLATAAYESGTFACAITLLAWGTPEQAAKLASISHLAVCDDYHSFTGSEYDVRIRMVALAVGAARYHGGRAVNAIVDGSLLQASGIGIGASFTSVMAWRAVSSCTTPYSVYVFELGDLEEGLVAPQIMMATHDLFDWRSDTAAGNHENGLSAIYWLGQKDVFHSYLEALLEKAVLHPNSALHAVASMTLMHFTAARYGSYEYRGTHQPACLRCVELLREATAGGQLEWAPRPPPQSFDQGHHIRHLGKLLIDRYEDHGLAQHGLSWFQYLVVTGRVWLFNLLADGVEAIDIGTDWA
ncbi:uncharacterized protein PG998_014536 [Apiospora kogelbergensis]|uniref:uncharacterized protein n=1 Tax=Apiospora kogelbergensis TaxID=1337665 RepID=UPI003130B0E1